MTQNSQYLFLFYPCHLSLSSLYLSPCSCRLCHAHFKRLWGCLVRLLSAEVKKHDMPSGYNYPMPATITVVPLQSFPEGRGHGAHTASPYPPEKWIYDIPLSIWSHRPHIHKQLTHIWWVFHFTAAIMLITQWLIQINLSWSTYAFFYTGLCTTNYNPECKD